jgi:predicted dithiol-disulfide oxidoreductase (DUF899 family)
MKNTMRDETGVPAVVDRSTFQAELDALRVREKAHTTEGDAIAAARRRLPMVEVDGATPLIGERGTVTLLDVFGRRRMLIATTSCGTPATLRREDPDEGFAGICGIPAACPSSRGADGVVATT